MAGYIEEMIHPTRKTDGIWIEKWGENIELLDEFGRLIEMNRQVYVGRIERLEQLCRDMYEDGCYSTSDDHYSRTSWLDDYTERMEQLGLLHETEYDPDTGLKWGEQYD